MLKKRKVTLDPEEMVTQSAEEILKLKSKIEPQTNYQHPSIAGSKKIQKINVDDIEIEEQVRKILDEEELKSLADSIKKLGLIQPIVVAEKSEGKYKLIAGYRRLTAVKNILKQPMIYAVVVPFIDVQDKEKLTAIQLAENIRRQNLTTFEFALAVGEYVYNYLGSTLSQSGKFNFVKYLYNIGMFQNKKEKITDEHIKDTFLSICSDLDISWSMLTTSLWLWSFPEEFYDVLLEAKNLTFSHCDYALRYRISSEDFIKKYLSKIEKGISIRDFIKLLQKEKKQSKTKKPTEQEKVYSKLSTLLSSLKRSKIIKYNSDFRREIADSLRRMAEELENLKSE